MRFCQRPAICITAALLATILPVVPVRAAPPADATVDELRKQVAPLITDLDAAAIGVRTRARTELLKLGPAVLPLLPAPELLQSAGAKEAVRDIRLTLEKAQARESVRATQVDTGDADRSLADIVARVQEQTGNSVDVSGLPDGVKRATVRIKPGKRDFWTLMDGVVDQLHLRYASSTADHTLRVERDPEQVQRRRQVVYDGAFRVEIASLDTHPIAGDIDHNLLRVQLSVRAEPRLRPLFLRFSARDIAASTEGQGALESFTPDASYELPLGERGQDVATRVDFRIPKAIKLDRVNVRGRLVVQTAAGSEKFEFNKLAKSSGRALRRGGVVTTLRNVVFVDDEKGNSSAVVRIGVAYETGGPAFESHRTWIFHNEAALVAADGTRIEPERDFNTALQADGAVAIDYRFERLTAPPETYQFLYVAPTLIINVPLPFEISGIPVSLSTERTQP